MNKSAVGYSPVLTCPSWCILIRNIRFTHRVPSNYLPDRHRLYPRG